MQKVITTNEVESKTAVVVSKEDVKQAPVTSIFESGMKAIKMPTPAVATNIFRFVLYAAFLTSEISNMFPEIGEHTSLIISKYCLRAIAVVHLLSRTFGIDISKIIPPGSQNTNSN